MPSEVFAYSDVYSKCLFSKRDFGAIFRFANVLLRQLAPCPVKTFWIHEKARLA